MTETGQSREWQRPGGFGWEAMEICGLLLDPIVKVAPGYQCLHCEGIAKRSNRNPFAREVEPVSALVPNACRMPGDQGSNTADLILGGRFSGRQFTQPLDRQICRGAISDAYFPPKGSGHYRLANQCRTWDVFLVR